MAGNKYYVVWEGRAPGIYTSWDEAREQVENFPGAKYKSYTNLETATEAFRGNPHEQLNIFRAMARHASEAIVNYSAFPDIRLDAITVDAACSRNPGPVEYRCVRVADGAELFHVGPLQGGSNNIGEFLAIVHGAAMLAKNGDTTTPIYSDSRTALAWVRAGHANTKITPNGSNVRLFELIRRAEAWLSTHRIANPLLKWDTDAWGEIPADFGRK